MRLRPERLEEQLKHMLYEAGLLREMHPPGAAAVSTPRYLPVTVNGQPVSKTLLVSTDGELNVTATTEGLTVEDPNIH